MVQCGMSGISVAFFIEIVCISGACMCILSYFEPNVNAHPTTEKVGKSLLLGECRLLLVALYWC